MFTGVHDDKNGLFDFFADNSFSGFDFVDWTHGEEPLSFSGAADLSQAPSVPDPVTGTDGDEVTRLAGSGPSSLSPVTLQYEQLLGTHEPCPMSSSMPIPNPNPMSTSTITFAAATSELGPLSDDTITQMRKVGQKTRERPKPFPYEATREMKQWILTNHRNPFPSFEIKNTWASKFQLSNQQINTFLANNRARRLGRLKDRIPQRGPALFAFINGLLAAIIFETVPTNPQH
jgi:hypothetical protein